MYLNLSQAVLLKIFFTLLSIVFHFFSVVFFFSLFFFILLLWISFVFYDGLFKKVGQWELFKDWPYGLQIGLNTRQTWKNGRNPSRKEIKTNKGILKLLILWYQWGKRYFQISSLKFHPLLQAFFHFLRQSKFWINPIKGVRESLLEYVRFYCKFFIVRRMTNEQDSRSMHPVSLSKIR